MAYGLKYIGKFDSNGETLQLEFYGKGYTGASLMLELPASPVVHSWNKDTIDDPVRGSSLAISIINGARKIEDFYSNSDDGYKVRLIAGTAVLFEGFLVQEDFSDDVVEYDHVFTLSATDNLGLLSDISLDEADRKYGGTRQTFNSQIIVASNPGDPLVINVSVYPPVPTAGMIAIFENTNSDLDGVPFTINTVTPLTLFIVLNMNESTTAPSGYYTGANVTYISPTDLTQRYNLAYYLGLCLKATGLELPIDCMMKIVESTNITHTFHNIYLRASDFKSGSNYQTCRQILEDILDRYNASLFQAKGRWQIIRWSEVMYQANTGYVTFDKDFNIIASGNYNSYINVGGDSVLATPQKSLFRPLIYDREQFDYDVPPTILLNSDLNLLGAQIGNYQTGSGASLLNIFEYFIPFWGRGFYYPNNTYTQTTPAAFIRVIYNSIGEEVERYICIKGPSSSLPNAIAAQAIEVNYADTLEFGFEIRCTHQPLTPLVKVDISIQPFASPVGVISPDYRPTIGSVPNAGRNSIWIPANGTATAGIVTSGADFTQWVSFDYKSSGFPLDGKMYVQLPQVRTDFLLPPSNTLVQPETHIRNIRFEIKPFVGGSGKTKGQQHTTSQPLTVKKRGEKQTSIDDSPKNQIIGTLFRQGNTNFAIRDRAREWSRGGFSETKKLGQITTFERLFRYRIARLKFEGAMMDVKKTNYISPLDLISWNRYANFFFLFARLEIDYAENTAKGTWQELFQQGETDANLVKTYKFEYQYE